MTGQLGLERGTRKIPRARVPNVWSFSCSHSSATARATPAFGAPAKRSSEVLGAIGFRIQDASKAERYDGGEPRIASSERSTQDGVGSTRVALDRRAPSPRPVKPGRVASRSPCAPAERLLDLLARVTVQRRPPAPQRHLPHVATPAARGRTPSGARSHANRAKGAGKAGCESPSWARVTASRAACSRAAPRSRAQAAPPPAGRISQASRVTVRVASAKARGSRVLLAAVGKGPSKGTTRAAVSESRVAPASSPVPCAWRRAGTRQRVLHTSAKRRDAEGRVSPGPMDTPTRALVECDRCRAGLQEIERIAETALDRHVDCCLHAPWIHTVQRRRAQVTRRCSECRERLPKVRQLVLDPRLTRERQK